VVEEAFASTVCEGIIAKTVVEEAFASTVTEGEHAIVAVGAALVGMHYGGARAHLFGCHSMSHKSNSARHPCLYQRPSQRV
jgi:hypothetical protein